MFGKLKEKLKNWTKKISEKVEEQAKKPEELEIQPEIKQKEKVEEVIKKVEKVKKELKKHEEVKDLIEKVEEIEKVEKEKQDQQPGKHGFFKKITSKISKIKISEKEFEIYAEDLKMLLLENNVAFEVAEKVVAKLKEEIVEKEFLKKEIEEQIKLIIKEIIEEILIEPIDIVKEIKKSEKPYVILFCGINGTGKTTTIAKIASLLQFNGISPVLAAADTFRAASIEQIKIHADKLKIKVISHDYGSDPAAVGFDAIKYAKKNKIDCVLIDTAGRMHSEKNLIKELEKIAKVTNPNLKIFVGEAITGNDSIEQVRSFDWAIKIDGIILTKADTDEKGGTALSVGYVTKKPILYLGTGQEYKHLEKFNKKKFIEELGL
ncbi:MAG: signal recognition particle-docking protein FtsY [archaeon]